MLIYLALILLLISLCWFYRQHILHLGSIIADKTNRLIGYHLLPTTEGSFETDIEDGLTSSQFDLTANLDQDDSRAGLKDKEEIMKIMKKQKVSFDQARLIRQQKLLKKNNIDPDTGLPLDPKFVSFS
ncbi:hypothetical protein G6F57_010862 [Rhizopus arrhizus]|uniref:Uncharacterized protein n=1 Tax=Rhizopus oryzae TaxID=64495 RepID=A0A9P7BN84_RHIOR|nr:hypothetical protein G6F23_007386 [Rhizopus arrhizus]KAG1411450.1 hypothetical protein G6F58_008547 [Rhizopus delemar]KAG0762476.1 hypothetical protein G6F24_006776 [Rhizopus arrhizus]KAG0783213.1 hypothetical protein G6F21_010664 [Rhizopus arrhizus]KAG0794729.1 hypothetical protein G6F22_005281 [Rhizopus arrhizus]